jgi:hypothetical protein
MTTYRVIFRGELASGYDRPQVQQKIAALYKLPVEKFDTWFTGCSVILKKSVPVNNSVIYAASSNPGSSIGSFNS